MSTNLRSMLAAGDFIVAPGVFEMFSAKIADRMDFKALYMTGYGISGSHLGLPDAGLVTYRDMVERARYDWRYFLVGSAGLASCVGADTGAGACTISIFALAFISSKSFFRFCCCICCISAGLICSSG